MAEWILWVKALHVLAVISWMVGLFYLPRLFVYHSDVRAGSESSELFKVMESRLIAVIMRPAAVASILSGLLLFWLNGFAIVEVWVFLKLLAVLAMVVFHGMLEGNAKQLSVDSRPHSSRYFRFINEVPTILLIIIVVAVVIKPFQ
jgi:putative membrane protein